EYVDEAIKDAEVNSEMNNIRNTFFFSGDIINVLSEAALLGQNLKADEPRIHKKILFGFSRELS
ncbi:MAG: hypothetical protein LAQ30_27995, partial [Acidobacteriia bacterium]|nr:hypothetical protein [Terriglobia bacterium]